MKQTFFMAVVNREYRGENAFNIVSPICKDKNQAIVFLKNEKSDFEDEFDNPWEVNEEKEDNFYLSDNHNYNIWGWIEEIEIETEFSGYRSAFVILSIRNVDGAEDNGELKINLVLTEAQSYRTTLYQEINKIVDEFKADYPCDEYGETNEYRLDKYWTKDVSFENFEDDDIDGELSIWFEIHDII